MGDIILTFSQLAAVAAVMTVALEQIFETRLYQSLFGKGVDGNPSKWAPASFELRPWISIAVGILVAYYAEGMAIMKMLGQEYATMVEGQLGPDGVHVDFILTGLILGGGTKDGEDKGWYVRAKYTYNPQWRFLLKYSDVDLWSPSTGTLLSDTYKTLSAAINFWITENSTIIPQIEYVDADRSDGSETLDYFRYTIGWRTTF